MSITDIDFSILDFIRENIACPVLDVIMKFITATGEQGIIWIVLALICLCFKKTRRCGAAMIIALLLAFIFGNLIIKPLVARPRPFIVRPETVLIIDPPGEYSFPSGHTFIAFSAATALFCGNKKFGIPALIYGALMGFSRLYLYVHFPTDVLCGALFGIITGVTGHFAVVLFMNVFNKEKRKNKMNSYAILGYPLGHSLSPQIHKRLFELSSVNAEYKVLEISPEQLKDNFPVLKELKGFNITIPHKISIIDMCDSLDDTAKRYMSVNCIKCGDTVVGYNTDCVGFTMSIKAMGATLDSRVLLLGCGGVGRMMAIETVLEGGTLTFGIRKEDEEIAKALCKELCEMRENSASYVFLPDVKGEFDLCVNATPLGMYPKTEGTALSKEQLADIDAKYFFDAVYNPRETTLMKLMAQKGVIVSGGMDMLVWQAVAAHTIWDGSTYNESDIKQLIEDMKELV